MENSSAEDMSATASAEPENNRERPEIEKAAPSTETLVAAMMRLKIYKNAATNTFSDDEGLYLSKKDAQSGVSK